MLNNKTFEEFLFDIERIETEYKNGGIELKRFFTKERFSVSLKEIYDDWANGKSCRVLGMFEYLLNEEGYEFKFIIEIYLPGYEIITNFSIYKQMDDDLNKFVKDFKDLNIQIIDAEQYGGILLSSEWNKFEKVIKSPEDLKHYIKRYRELVKHMISLFKGK